LVQKLVIGLNQTLIRLAISLVRVVMMVSSFLPVLIGPFIPMSISLIVVMMEPVVMGLKRG
jgi:hypothetical protein